MKGFTLGLIMKMRVFGTLKWCILSQLLGNLIGEKCLLVSIFFFTSEFYFQWIFTPMQFLGRENEF